MATTQFPIVAGLASTEVLPASNIYNRRMLVIRNYNGSASTMWVAFGRPATAGTNGEMELRPGDEYTFGNGGLSQRVETGSFFYRNCPSESVNVIVGAGSATGMVMVLA